MFEHQLVQQQLREVIEEKNRIMKQFLQVQNDINSLTKLVRSRLYKKFDIPKTVFDVKRSGNFDSCSANGSPVKLENRAFSEGDKVNEDSSEETPITVKIDKSQYMNSSNLPQIDTLAKEVYQLFYNISNYINAKKDEEEESDLELENRDRVGYVITGSNDFDFAIPKTKGLAIPESVKIAKSRTQIHKPGEKLSLNGPTGGASMQMTSVLSNSKVSSTF